jgi:multicomponent Na+:H+ antiporter subunit C
VSNALPQALILTAIVIGFGVLAVSLALVFRSCQSLGTLNTDEMRIAEPVEPTSGSDGQRTEGSAP